MLRFHSARWSAVLLSTFVLLAAFAVLTPTFDMSGNTTESVVAGGAAPGDMIWG